MLWLILRQPHGEKSDGDENGVRYLLDFSLYYNLNAPLQYSYGPHQSLACDTCTANSLLGGKIYLTPTSAIHRISIMCNLQVYTLTARMPGSETTRNTAPNHNRTFLPSSMAKQCHSPTFLISAVGHGLFRFGYKKPRGINLVS